MSPPRPAAGKTARLANPNISVLDSTALYVFSAPGTEARGRAPLWNECRRDRPLQCLEVVSHSDASIEVEVGGAGRRVIDLRDGEGLRELFRPRPKSYLDISGVPHHVWAPLLRAGLEVCDGLVAVYTEPAVYKRHTSPTSRGEYDLSEGFRGIAPLPGFANLRGPKDEKDAVLVSFLGFEGRRASYVALALDPVPKVCAVVGVPGFRAEYPQITFASNAEFLGDSRAYASVRMAMASCPFEAFDTLTDIQRDRSGRYMYIAPIGTKPHALGAVCYVLKHPESTEIMYDNPIRKPGRTEGIGLVHFYTLKPSYVVS